MKTKGLKRFILSILIFWVVLIIAGMLFSRSFQDKIIAALTDQADRHIKAEIHLRKNNIHFSVFKKFPLASVELRDVVVKIPDDFQFASLDPMHGDTLLYARHLFLQLNMRQLLRKEYQLEKISIKNGYLQVLTDEQGHSSMNIIAKSSGTTDFRASIKSFLLSNVSIYSESANSRMQSSVTIKKGEASGSFTPSNFTVKVKAEGTAEKMVLRNEALKPMQKVKLDATLTKSENQFLIHKGLFSIGNIPMQLAGSFQSGEKTMVDLLFSAKNVSVKQIDNNLLNDLLGRKGFDAKAGVLSINASVKGFIEHSVPVVKADFVLSGAKVLDTERGIAFSDIYARGLASNHLNRQIRNTFGVKIDSFNISFGNSNQYGSLQLINFKNPSLSAQLTGELTTQDINWFAEVKFAQLHSGSIANAIQIKGYPKKEAKNKYNITGGLTFNNLQLQATTFHSPRIWVNGNLQIRNNHSLRLDSLYFQALNSNLLVSGNLTNFQKKAAEPVFDGSIVSSHLVVEDFLSKNEENEKRETHLRFPDSIIVNGQIKVDSFAFGKFNAANIRGFVSYKNQLLKINGFRFDAFSGTTSGDVSIQQYPSKDIQLTAKAFIRRNNLEELFYGFNNFGQEVINSKHLNGFLSGTINYVSSWDDQLHINKGSIIATGDILIEKGELNNYAPLLGLSKFIEVEELKQIKFDNLQTTINIRNKKVLLDQTKIASSAISFSGSGIHDFDNKYEYRLQVGLSDILWKKARKRNKDISEFGYIVQQDKDRTLVPVLIAGKGSSFDVKYDKRTSRANFRDKMQQEKQELRNLFSNQEVEQESAPAVETVIEEKEPALQKTDSGKYQHKSNNFAIEWDDSEEDEDEEME